MKATKAKMAMSDTELETLHKTVAEGIVTLHRESEERMGRARILFYALSGYLEQEGIVQSMAMCAAWMEEQSGKPVEMPTPSELVN